MEAISNKTAIVTGASRGIGAAIAERLAADGFNVVVNYTGSEKEAIAVAERIVEAGGRAIIARADVSSPGDVHRMFVSAETKFGAVDVLVNNAGIMSLSRIDATDDEVLERTIDVNL